ncbi:sulfatase [Fodinibius sediminis]|uniref:Arylsulfatase A n=1 Tax=Fodinibius sediminis TaxID=1214077 RepID=A0A521C463_9BACT|nr:sulfatase [Fodinibius sediminis]SMO54232.1 Arylsulfatase A [Fodinibius sediminis]
MKKNSLFFLCLLLVTVIQLSCNDSQQKEKEKKPNIILFLVDDLGWQDTSVPFHKEETPFNERYETPNMERLAEQGMLFTNAYSASPVCTPTRSSIITGKNPANTNITDWTLRNDVRAMDRVKPESDFPLFAPEWRVEGVQPDTLLLTSLLRKQGYRTIHVGKAHFGALETAGADPENLGFDVNVAGHAAGAPGSYWPEDRYGNSETDSIWGVPGMEQYYESQANLTEALTIEANKAIDEAVADDKPFYINMAHYTVHAPIMADRRYYQKYLEAGIDSAEAKYASMIEGMDRSLGQLLKHLEEEEVAKETIILFMSDNGGLSVHSRGSTPMGTGGNTHNKPLRSGKGSAYEGGIRVPMIAAWAEEAGQLPLQKHFPIQPGSRNDTPVISEDFYPTILELAGLGSAHRAYRATDGRSFLPLLKNAEASGEDRLLFWHYPHKWGPDGPGYEPFTAVRDGAWKLIYFYRNQEWELYNLDEDIGETRNLLDERREVARRLAEKMTPRMRTAGAQTPVSKVTGKPVGLPVLAEE